jgi:hypothetical protein
MANTIREPFGAGPGSTDINLGTVNDLAGLTCDEYGNGSNHRTVLTMDAMAVGSPTGAAALGFGKLLYTLPAGACLIKASKINFSLQAGGTVDADTPDVGLGTVIASGVVSVLSGTATFENILTGQTFNDCNGTAEVKTALATSSPFALVVETADAHTIYLNVADTWAGADDLTATGTIVLEWSFLN